MPTGFDHLLFLLLAALLPIWAGVFGSRRLKRADPDDLPRVRLSTYRRAMVMLWLLSLTVSVWWLIAGRSLSTLGLIPRPTAGLAGVAVGAVIIAWFMIRERRQALASATSLARIRERLRYVELVLPHTRLELGWFYRLAVTAGLCEELLYRGFMLWYLTHWFAFWPAAAIAALFFGLGHSYQGPRGVLLTAAVGAFLAAVYWITGSLLAPMVLHALMDIHSGHLAFVALDHERRTEAEAEIEVSDQAEIVDTGGSAV